MKPKLRAPKAHLRVLAAVRRLCHNPEGTRVPNSMLAREAGTSVRTVIRALDALEAAGMLVREGGQGRVALLRTCDNSSTTTEEVTQVPRRPGDCDDLFSDEELGEDAEERPGCEYIRPKDPEAAADALARWCYAVGRGPRWALERGQRLARLP